MPSIQNSSRNIPEALALHRGIELGAEASWGQLSDPLQLGMMEAAVRRILKACDNKETIGIIGDYDADGITGTAQLVRFFRRRNIDPVVILPHRMRDGYGVKKEFIDALHKRGVSLLLTVDTGISHAAEIAEARSHGMDVIITDHHALHGEHPDALLIHPLLLEDAHSPLRNLAGSGVAFTLVRALEGGKWQGMEEDVALAAIGTVGDVVSLTGENRTIVQLGLRAMTEGVDTAIYRLAQSIRKGNEPLTSTHIGYRMAPRINAAGRIADPDIALRALLGSSDDLERLHVLNAERQEATRRMMEVAEDNTEKSDALLIAHSPMFHPGIIGLIAGKLAEKYGKPSLVACTAGETVTCSLRSFPAYSVAAALARCSEPLTSFGGHIEAAGCTLPSSQWKTFTAMLQEDARAMCTEDLAPTIMIDAPLEESDCTLQLAKALQKLEPFGAGNLEPRFLLQNLPVPWKRTVGQNDAHLQCGAGNLRCIGFGLGHLAHALPDRADFVCRLGVNVWNGRESVQLVLEDIRGSQDILPTKAISLGTKPVTKL